MSGLGARVVDALRGPGTQAVEAGAHRVEVDALDADRLGVVVERIGLRGPIPDPVGTAERLAEHLRPAGEPLELTERAPELGGAVLRGARRPDGRFFEVQVDAEGAELRRHRVDAEGRRRAEPFSLTREQLGDLVDGLDAGLGAARPPLSR